MEKDRSDIDKNLSKCYYFFINYDRNVGYT